MIKIKLALLLFSTIVASESSGRITATKSCHFKSAMLLAQIIVETRSQGISERLKSESEPIILDEIDFHMKKAEITPSEKAIFDRYVNRHAIRFSESKK
jgi:hypothetical protein